MKSEKGRFRAARTVAIGVTILVALAAIVGGAAPLIIVGPRFGRVIERVLPRTRGQIHIGGGRWTWAAVLAWARGRPIPFELEDIRITDPEGIEVLRVARLSGRVTMPRAAVGTIVDELRVETAAWRFAETKGRQVGFLTALESRVPPNGPNGETGKGAGFRGGLSIRDARLDGIEATFDLHDWGLVLTDVHATASLSVSAGGKGQSLAFEIRDADARSGGRLRILPGAAAFTLPFTRARLDRVATTSDAPDAIRLEASGVTTGTSILAFAGTFTGVYGVSRPRIEPGIDLHAQLGDAADAIRAVASSHGLEWPAALGGRGARLTLGFVGPFAHLRIDARTSLISPDGGSVGGDLSVDERGLAVDLSFTRFATTPLLPAPLVALAGGTLQGTARGRFDSGTASASMERMALTLTRSADGARPRVVQVRLGPVESGRRQRPGGAGWTLGVSGARFAAGTLRLPRLTAGLWGGRFSASGRIRLTDRDRSGAIVAPKLDLTLSAERLSSRNLFGANFVEGDVSFRARARGSLNDLAIDIALPPGRFLRVIGERVQLPDKIKLRFHDQDLLIPTFTLHGPRKSELTLSGRINVKGRLDLDIGVSDFPFDRLPGLAETTLPLAGRMSGRLVLSGEAGRPALAGQVSFDPVTFQGRRVGGGLVTISPGARGAIHAQGRLVEGIDADGSLVSVPGGLTGDATLTLKQLHLDPFLAALPGGVTAAGVLSGTIVAHIQPGQAPRAMGRLSQLTLIVTPPSKFSRSNKMVRPIDLHSEGDILLSAQTGAGPIRIGPARFAGNLGSFEIEGESKGESVSGAVRGRVLLDAFAPVTTAWVDHLSGALDVDLRAAQASASGSLQVNGEIAIAAPLSGRARAAPFETRIPSGRIRFLGDTVETKSLPVTFESGVLGAGAIRRTRGSAQVSARVSNTSGRPAVHAAIDLGRLELDAPLLGHEPIAISGGRIEVDDRTLTLRALPVRLGQQVNLTVGATGGPPGVIVFDSFDSTGITRLDLPLRGDLRGIESGGIRIDRAAFGLRLQGQPRRSLLLAGDIELANAHAPSNIQSLGRGPAGAKTSPGLPPELERMRLDLHVHAKPGAIEVDVRHIPDIHVGVDYHVGGTLKNPDASGQVRGAGAYSVFMLWLGRLLR